MKLQDATAYDSMVDMKSDIHPIYFPDAKITCACGTVIRGGGTKKEMSVEICSACHPFYTGKEKIIDTAGRVEKFRARVAKAKSATPKQKPKKTARATVQKTTKTRTKKSK